jgi:hypothetical protein
MRFTKQKSNRDVAFLLLIQKVLGSDPGVETAYPEVFCGFSPFLQAYIRIAPQVTPQPPPSKFTVTLHPELLTALRESQTHVKALTLYKSSRNAGS